MQLSVAWHHYSRRPRWKSDALAVCTTVGVVPGAFWRSSRGGRVAHGRLLLATPGIVRRRVHSVCDVKIAVSSSVRLHALCVLIALRKVADAQLILMGWPDEDWRAACARVQQHELALMQVSRATHDAPATICGLKVANRSRSRRLPSAGRWCRCLRRAPIWTLSAAVGATIQASRGASVLLPSQGRP
jgi:hypothetical protein